MPRPSVEDLPPALAGAARRIAARLGDAGHRGWIVGGAVRDLALGATVHDLDMASAGTPAEVEPLFERTIPVGRAFGTVLVVEQGLEVQLTTFRSEIGYSDRRRPDEVRYGHTIEEDAQRRDFTCNALYLDPLNDEFADPAGGLADLERGVLRCVGDPAERFGEDGLRLLRMARFAAACGLAVAPEVLAAARACRESLDGVSVERVHQELGAIFRRRDAARALELLHAQELLTHALFRGTRPPPDFDAPRAVARLAFLEAGEPQPDLATGLALLLGPRDPAAPEADWESRSARAEAALAALRPSRAERGAVLEAWRGERELARILGKPEAPSRARRIRLVRSDAWPRVLGLGRSRARVDGLDPEPVERLARFAAALGDEERFPAPLLASEDLAAAGLPPGPAWNRLLTEAEDLQLEGALADREAALAWLAERSRALAGPARSEPGGDAQEGGKTRRKA